MPRIVYLLLSDGGISGGHKMILRHVETLCELGFNAVCYIGAQSRAPTWLEYKAPLELGTPLRPDDIVVLPDDAIDAMRTCLNSDLRTLVFAQSTYNFAATTYDIVDQFPPQRFPPIIAIAPRQASVHQRAFPDAKIDIIPCFADERIFKPSDAKRRAVALVPRKRPLETRAIHRLVRRLHPRHADLEWISLINTSELEVAEAFGASSLFLSLSRLEAVGLAPLEAMASGCICAGFTGVGGLEFATEENGFWVGEDDCEAAADALARAADLVQTGGAPLRHYLEAGFETARKWSYESFRTALEDVWMRLAPEARVRGVGLASEFGPMA